LHNTYEAENRLLIGSRLLISLLQFHSSALFIDPVRNKWIIAFGRIACGGVIPLALIARIYPRHPNRMAR
jgi:hypothetical protein